MNFLFMNGHTPKDLIFSTPHDMGGVHQIKEKVSTFQSCASLKIVMFYWGVPLKTVKRSAIETSFILAKPYNFGKASLMRSI